MHYNNMLIRLIKCSVNGAAHVLIDHQAVVSAVG